METHGYTQEDAAKVIGKARNTVTELLSLLKLPEDIKTQCRTSDVASKSFLVELARMDADAMKEAWHTLQTTGQASVRVARARKTGELMKEEIKLDAPFKRAERALWIAAKTIAQYEQIFSKIEKEKLFKIKQQLDKHFGQL